jgi:hypothetical protein
MYIVVHFILLVFREQIFILEPIPLMSVIYICSTIMAIIMLSVLGYNIYIILSIYMFVFLQ